MKGKYGHLYTPTSQKLRFHIFNLNYPKEGGRYYAWFHAVILKHRALNFLNIRRWKRWAEFGRTAVSPRSNPEEVNLHLYQLPPPPPMPLPLGVENMAEERFEVTEWMEWKNPFIYKGRRFIGCVGRLIFDATSITDKLRRVRYFGLKNNSKNNS